MNEQEKQALIKWLTEEIAFYKKSADEIPFGLADDESNVLRSYEIALAALSAQPSALVIGKFGAGIKAIAYEGAPSQVEGTLLYTAPPAPAMQPVKLPEKSDVKMGGDKATRSLLTGMNMMRKSCAEAIRAAGYEVEE